MKMVHPLEKYIRPGFLSTTSCAGCGNGIIAQSVLRAIDELKIKMDDFVFVSGIGCAAWIPSPFFNADVLHTTHGRPIAFATGVKLSSPKLKVMIISGDGDLVAIGGNHFIHAARRNLDLTVVCANNGIYGMTGGQVAPTTPLGLKTTTTPYGNLERPFDLCRLAQAAGAVYVARWTTYHARQLTQSVKKAIQKKGFSFIEVISQCPVHFGRRTGAGDAAVMMQGYRKNSVNIKKIEKLKEEELKGKIVVGEYVDRKDPELCEEIAKMNQRLRWKRR
ncbi:MAG: thiamine pyrophosphate-dependent enzyme [bacterium]